MRELLRRYFCKLFWNDSLYRSR